MTTLEVEAVSATYQDMLSLVGESWTSADLLARFEALVRTAKAGAHLANMIRGSLMVDGDPKVTAALRSFLQIAGFGGKP